MDPRIEISEEKMFSGKKLVMTFDNNRTSELWKGFMPSARQLSDIRLGKEYYSIEVFPVNYFKDFKPENKFEKWATVQIREGSEIPKGMDTLTSPKGMYAVFVHHGPASKGPETYNYIFREWLPNSGYEIDDRPHFAIMDDKYKHNEPDSEEEIWIPIVKKQKR